MPRPSLADDLSSSVVHGGSGVTVGVSRLETVAGFCVEDTGSEIPDQHRGNVFEHWDTTNADGTGLAIAESPPWTASADESDDGSARFEFRL